MPTSRNEALEFRASHAFVIGINNYPLLGANLEGAINDARAVAERLCVHQGFDNVLLMEDVGLDQIRQLFDWLNSDHSGPLHIPDEIFTGFEGLGEPYSSNIQWLDFKPRSQSSPLSKWRRNILRTKGPREIEYNKDKDSVVFYFAGHGFSGKADSSPRGYLAATDSVKDQNGTTTLIEMEDLHEAMDKFDCKHTLLLLDCCFSGKFRFADANRGGPVAFLVPMYAERFERYKQGKAWQVLTSSGPNQTAADLLTIKDLREHSPFASTLVQALEGKADIPGLGIEGRLKDGIITASELFLYVSDKVEALTRHDRPQNPSLFPMKKHGNGEFIFVNPELDIEQFQFPEDPRNNPYKGLKSFETEDYKLFYGREKDTKDIIDQLLTEKEDNAINRLLFVSGASSAGKSSIIQAGVFPQLQRKYELEGKEIHFIKVRPNDLVEQSKDIDKIKDQKVRGNERFETILAKLESEDNYLLLIDQYEEIFTHPNEAILEIRVQQLFDAAVIQVDNLTIFSLRSDFEWKIKASKLERYFKNETTYRLPSMDLKSLRRALVGPAFWALSQFENKKQANGNMDEGEGLINRILADVANAPGALSILSFTMFRMYQLARALERVNGVYTFTHKMYKDMGGVDGAISSRADQFYNGLATQKEQYLMKQLFLRMVTIYDGSYARRRVYFSEIELDNTFSLANTLQKDETSVDLYFANANLSELRLLYGNEELKELINELEREDLIVQDKDEFGQSYVEPAHDALIKHWNRCRAWLDELDKDSLMLRRQLWENILDAQLIIQQQEEESMQNMAVAEVQQADDIVLSISPFWDTNPKLDTILASIINHFRSKKVKQVSIKEKEKEKEKNNFLTSLSKEASALYQSFISNPINNPQINLSETLIEYSIETILELFEKSHHWVNEVELFFIYRSILRKEQRFQKLKAERDAAERTAQRATSNLVLNNSTPNQNLSESFRLAEMAGIIDRNNPKVLERLFRDYYELNNTAPIFKTHYVSFHQISQNDKRSYGLAVSESGQYYAIGNRTDISVFNAFTAKEIARWKAHDPFIWDLSFTEVDGRLYLISVGQDKKINIWRKPEDDLQTSWPLFKSNSDHTREITALAVSKDGSKIVTGSTESNGEVRLWENWTSANNSTTLIGRQNKGIEALSISDDGEKIRATSWEHKLWIKKDHQWTSQDLKISGIDRSGTFSADQESFYAVSQVPQKKDVINRYDFNQNSDGEVSDEIIKKNFRTLEGFSFNEMQDELVVIESLGILGLYSFSPESKVLNEVLYEIRIPMGKILNFAASKNNDYLLIQQNERVTFINRSQIPKPNQSSKDIKHENVDAATITINENNNLTPYALIASPNNALLLVNYNERSQVDILNAKDYSLVRTLTLNTDIYSAIFSPDSTSVFTGDEVGRIHLWNIIDQSPPILVNQMPDIPESSLLNKRMPINALAFAKSENILILSKDLVGTYEVGHIQMPENNSINEPLPILPLEEIVSNTLHFSFSEKKQCLLLILNESLHLWPFGDNQIQHSTLLDFDGIVGSVQISPSVQYLAYYRKGDVVVHTINEEGTIASDPSFEFSTDFSDFFYGRISFNEEETIIFFTNNRALFAWSLDTEKRLLKIDCGNCISSTPLGCIWRPTNSITTENFFQENSRVLFLSSKSPQIHDLEFSVEGLLKISHKNNVFGTLTRDEIARFEVTEYFPNLGLLTKDGQLEYSDQFQDEHSLISFGDYFFERAKNMNFLSQKLSTLERALRLYQAAAAKGEVLTEITYSIIIEDIEHLIAETSEILSLK